MAHPEHLKILLRSTEEWNRWRKAHEDVQPDLEQADLHGADLYRADLGRTNLRAANLTRAHLFEAYLGKADLQDANLQGANLARAYLAGANLAGAHLRGADLKEANLSGADLTGASIREAYLTATRIDDVRGMDDTGRLIWEIVNQGARGRDLRGVDLARARLFDAGFEDADLRGANFEGAYFYNANLSGANLEGANLRMAVLNKTDLTGASLDGVDLTATKFKHVRGIDEKGRPVGHQERHVALRIVIEDGLGFPHTFVPASYVCLLFCTVPETWLGHDRKLLPDKSERILEWQYGKNWRSAHEDGSRYVVRRFDVEPLASADALERARQSVDETSTGVRYWFYLVDEEDQLKTVDKAAFFEEARRDAAVQQTTLSTPEDPGERQWRALMARYGPPTPFRFLTDEERRAAVRERRALAMTMWRDGFGGGSVGCSLLETEDPEPSGDDVHRGVTVYVAFPPPCRLTPEIIRNLKRNWWEDLREVPFGDEAS